MGCIDAVMHPCEQEGVQASLSIPKPTGGSKLGSWKSSSPVSFVSGHDMTDGARNKDSWQELAHRMQQAFPLCNDSRMGPHCWSGVSRNVSHHISATTKKGALNN